MLKKLKKIKKKKKKKVDDKVKYAKVRYMTFSVA